MPEYGFELDYLVESNKIVFEVRSKNIEESTLNWTFKKSMVVDASAYTKMRNKISSSQCSLTSVKERVMGSHGGSQETVHAGDLVE